VAKYNPFEINTGYIFSDVYDNWKMYDRDFLKRTFKEALDIIHYTEKKFIAEYSEDRKDYFKRYTEFRFPRDLKEAQDEDSFPFPEYFLRYKETNDEYPSIVSFRDPINITKESSYFDLFFGLKLSVIDIMRVEDFLQYHYENTFKGDFSEYQLFLENLLIKYSEFLKDKHGLIIKRFINIKMTAMTENDIKENEKNKEYTIARQVLAIHYMLEQLGVSQYIDKTEIARFAQFLTGRELGASNIKNTNIYKRVNSVLSNSEKAAESDLQFVREYFEKLGLSLISEKITKEINSKE